MRWYKHDTDAFMGGTVQLTLEEIGAYTLILNAIYARDGSIPDEGPFACRLLRCDPRVWRRIRSRLVGLGKLQSDGKLLTNLRATCELHRAEVRRTFRQNTNEINKKLEKRSGESKSLRVLEKEESKEDCFSAYAEKILPHGANAPAEVAYQSPDNLIIYTTAQIEKLYVDLPGLAGANIVGVIRHLDETFIAKGKRLVERKVGLEHRLINLHLTRVEKEKLALMKAAGRPPPRLQVVKQVANGRPRGVQGDDWG